MQKSTSFLIPMMGFKEATIYSSLRRTYVGNVDYEGNDEWGNYFYLEFFYEKLTPTIEKELHKHPQYIAMMDTIDESLLFIFRITDYQKKNIVTPFLEGRYSCISRDYVSEHFPKYNKGMISNNWRILMKDEWDRPSNIQSLRDYWFSRIGVRLPANAEVWSRPEKKDEIYGFETSLDNVPDEGGPRLFQQRT